MMAPFQHDYQRCRASSSPVLALILLKPQRCMDWMLPFTEVASLNFPNAYKTTHPVSTSEEENNQAQTERSRRGNRAQAQILPLA